MNVYSAGGHHINRCHTYLTKLLQDGNFTIYKHMNKVRACRRIFAPWIRSRNPVLWLRIRMNRIDFGRLGQDPRGKKWPTKIEK